MGLPATCSEPLKIVRVLQEYPWPGNIRELESIIERSVYLFAGPGFYARRHADIFIFCVLPDRNGGEAHHAGTVRNQVAYRG